MDVGFLPCRPVGNQVISSVAAINRIQRGRRKELGKSNRFAFVLTAQFFQLLEIDDDVLIFRVLVTLNNVAALKYFRRISDKPSFVECGYGIPSATDSVGPCR